jgi:hypothetical protein
MLFVGAAPSLDAPPSFSLTQVGHAVYIDASLSGQAISQITLPDGSKVVNSNKAYWRAIDYGTYQVSVANSTGQVATQEYVLSSQDGLCYSASINGTGQIDTEVRLKLTPNSGEAFIRTIAPGGAALYIPNTHVDPAQSAQSDGQYTMMRIDSNVQSVKLVHDGRVTFRTVTEYGNQTSFTISFLFPGQINVDLNNDEIPDLNMDTDGDDVADTNVDTNGDMVVDKNPGVWSEPPSKPTEATKPQQQATRPQQQQGGGQVQDQEQALDQALSALEQAVGGGDGPAQIDSHVNPQQTNPTEHTDPTETTPTEPPLVTEGPTEPVTVPEEVDPVEYAIVTETDEKVTFTLRTEDTALSSIQMAEFLKSGRTVEVVIENPNSVATYNPTEGLPVEFKEEADAQMQEMITWLDEHEMVTGKELNEFMWGMALTMLDTFANNPVSQTDVKVNPMTGR